MSSTASHETHPNRLIADLPEDVRDRFLSCMDVVCLNQRQVIYEQGEPITHVYFPCSAVVSLMLVMENGGSVAVAVIGNEGFLGIPRYFGVETAYARGMVEIAGEVRRMRSDDFEREIKSSAMVSDQLRRYANRKLAQIARTAGCNRLHGAEQRGARWLLMLQDRTDTSEFPLTQEMVAEILGITRTSAGLVLQSLEQQGMIRATRGKITVLDRVRLESASCECYRTDRVSVSEPLS